MWGGWCDFFLFFSFLFFSFLFLRRKHILPQATRGSQEAFAPILPRAHCPPANEFSSWEQLSTVIGSHARTCTGAIYTAIQRLAASFKLGVPRPLKAFQRMLGLMASASSVLQLGLLHMPRCSSGPLEEPSVDGTGRAPGHGLQKEGGLDRHLQLRLGGGVLCDGKLVFGLWSKKEGYLHINCLGMLAICLGLHTSLPDLTGHQVLGWIPFLCLTPSPSSYP